MLEGKMPLQSQILSFSPDHNGQVQGGVEIQTKYVEVIKPD